MIEHLFIAPIGVLVGVLLARIIADETRQYDREFLFYFALFILAAIVFASHLVAAAIFGVLAVVCAYYRRVWLLSLTVAGLIWASSFTSAVFVMVSLMVVTGYFIHHGIKKRLWVLAGLPTLISAILLLL